jgi:putative ubiquitin-RnfH superfamily antitoxin RatB of RatAB toxin-antitoxin module
MLVKVAPVGSPVIEVALADGAKVSDAIEAADVDTEGRSIRVNSEASTLTSPVRDGDIITLHEKIEGGRI